MVAIWIFSQLVCWFGVKVEWVKLNLPHWFIVGSHATWIVQSLVVPFIAAAIINGMAGIGTDGFWWSVKNTGTVVQTCGYVVLVSAIIIPLIQSGYLSLLGWKTHALIFAIQDNRKASEE